MKRRCRSSQRTICMEADGFYPENSWKSNHAVMYERWEKSYGVLSITLDNDGFEDGFSQKLIPAGNVT